MNKKKLGLPLLFVFVAAFIVLFFWEQSLILIIILLVLSILKNKLIPIEKEVLMFIISAVVGAGAESVAMVGGSWAYTSANLINFPIWLPFLWGLAGVTGISLYQSVTGK